MEPLSAKDGSHFFVMRFGGKVVFDDNLAHSIQNSWEFRNNRKKSTFTIDDKCSKFAMFFMKILIFYRFDKNRSFLLFCMGIGTQAVFGEKQRFIAESGIFNLKMKTMH